MKLLIITLLTGFSINAQCYINERGNLECPKYKLKEFAQDKKDVKYWQEMFKAKSDSLAKCAQIAKDANKRHSDAMMFLDKQRERELQLCAEKGQNDAKIALNDYKSKFWNRRDIVFVGGFVFGGMVAIWAADKFND